MGEDGKTRQKLGNEDLEEQGLEGHGGRGDTQRCNAGKRATRSGRELAPGNQHAPSGRWQDESDGCVGWNA